MASRFDNPNFSPMLCAVVTGMCSVMPRDRPDAIGQGAVEYVDALLKAVEDKDKADKEKEDKEKDKNGDGKDKQPSPPQPPAPAPTPSTPAPSPAPGK